MPLLRLASAVVVVSAAVALSGCGGGGGDPDGGPPDAGQSSSIGFEALSSSGEESQALVQLPVVLTQPFRQSAAVVDVLVRGTAGGNGEDFNLVQATLNLPAGQTRGTVELDVVADGFDEPDETVELTLSNPRTSGGDTLTVGANQTHVYTIRAQSTATFPTLSFSAQSSLHPEAATAVTVSLSLSRPSATPISVSYARTGGTATPTSDFELFNAGTLTFAPGVTVQSITLVPRDDGLDEDDETVVIGLSNPVGEVMLGGATTHTVVLTDDDASPILQFGTPTLAVSEGDPAPTVPVTLSAASGRTVTASYAASGGTATGGGVDYTLAAGTVTFQAGIVARSIPISMVQDTTVEGPENVFITLGSPVGAQLGTNSMLELTIRDDDVQPSVGFSLDTSSATENAVSALLTVTLSNPYSSAVTVGYSVTGGTATSGSDYTLPSGTLTFPIGATSRTITLNILNDSRAEDPETVVVSLGSPINATLGPTSVHTFTINDEDPPPPVSFVSPASPSGEASPTAGLQVSLGANDRLVTVNYAVTGGTATGGGTDYTLAAGMLTFPPGTVLQTITVELWEDLLDEVDETVVVTLSGPVNAALGATPAHTLTITDNDQPPTVGFGAAASSDSELVAAPSIPVVLSAPSGRNVTVNYVVPAGGTATGGGTDYTLPGGTLTIPAGATSLDLPIRVVDDTIDEVDETVPISLTGAGNATLSALTAHTFTIADDDSVPTVQFAADASSGGEATLTPMTVTATLSNPSAQTVTVAYSVTGGTAISGTDFTGGSGTLTFTPGTVSRVLPFSVINDARNEAAETVVFTLSAPTNASLGTPAWHTYTITDNDPTPSLQFDLTASTGGEATGANLRAVRLSAVSGQTVTVDYAVTAGTATGGGVDYTVVDGTLTFAPGVVTQDVVIDVAQDAGDEANETVEITLSAPANATLGTRQVHTFTLVDDDPLPDVSFTSGSSSGLESVVGPITLGVVLTPASLRTVTVNFAATGGTALNGTDYFLTAGSLTFLPGETMATIQFTINDELLVEPNETAVISLSAPAPATATVRVPGNHTYTILNND